MFLFLNNWIILFILFKYIKGDIITTVVGNGQSEFMGDLVSATNTSINSPTSVNLDSNGNIYITDTGNNRIRKVNTLGIISTIAGNDLGDFSGDGGLAIMASLKSPKHVYIDLKNNVYIADSGNNRVRYINSNGFINTITGNDIQYPRLAINAPISHPESIYIHNSGNIYITDTKNDQILMINTIGIATIIAGNKTITNLLFNGDGKNAKSAIISNPIEIIIDSFMNIFISSNNNYNIRKINSLGIITTFAGNGIMGYTGDNGLAKNASITIVYSMSFDSKNNLYFTDTNKRINTTPLKIQNQKL